VANKLDEINKNNQLNDNVEVARLFLKVLGLFKHNIINIFEDTGITPLQAMTMGILSKGKKMKMTELSSKLSLSNSTVSGIVDRLEKQGMVERERSCEDRRVVYVIISPKFNEVHGDVHKLIQENAANIMKKGTPEEINGIVEGLNTLKRILEGQEK
jgi:DNA-binding MarR family transcriptional regulator